MDLVAICPVDKWLGVLCACADGGDAYAELWIGKAPLPAVNLGPHLTEEGRARVRGSDVYLYVEGQLRCSVALHAMRHDQHGYWWHVGAPLMPTGHPDRRTWFLGWRERWWAPDEERRWQEWATAGLPPDLAEVCERVAQRAAPAVPPALGKTRAIVCSGGRGGRRCEAVELELGAPPPPRPPAHGPGPARAMPAPPPVASSGPGPVRAVPPAPAGAQLDMWGRR
ncbi:MAG: hypothetical protein IT372_07875 [Polyangiaceae bacterium]|nr:hypothetical protein [Polyangiaceae bacterium]